jgi:tetratricopeptide (TPR) repeat protein
MSVSWEHAFDACEPPAADLLRAIAALDLPAVSSPAIGAAAGLTPAQTDTALADLREAGWITARGVVASARTWLVNHVVEPGRVVEVVAAFLDYHAEALRKPAQVEAWLAAHHAEILAALAASDRPGLRRQGAALALAVWPSAVPPWWDELATKAEALAITLRDPPLLTDLLHASAARFAERGEPQRAEEQWVRALAIIRRPEQLEAASRARGEAVLTGLSDLYRAEGRLSNALDADLGLVDLRLAAGDPVGIAEAMARVATTMRAAGRPGTAAEYLAQADEAMAALTETGAANQLPLHARILIDWGRALWEDDEPDQARRRWSRALAMLIDIDDEAANHVRTLLATAPQEELPAEPTTHPSPPANETTKPSPP